MKNEIVLSLMIAGSLVSMSFSGALAQAGEHPCKEIKAACESAGFLNKGHKTGKGLHIDCMQKLLKGESVQGVTVSPDKIQACKAKKEAKKDAKKSS